MILRIRGFSPPIRNPKPNKDTMKNLLLTTTAILLSAAGVAPAAGFVMYDFEPDWQHEDWRVSLQQSQSVEPSPRFGTNGPTSMRLRAEPSSIAPEFGLRLWDNNYEPYNRLSMDLTNRSTEEVRLIVGLLGDNRNGYRFHVTVPPLSHKRVVHKIDLPSFVRHDNIHFLTLTAEEDMPVDVHVDNIVALRKDDPEPDAEAATLGDQIAALRQGALRADIDAIRADLRLADLGLPEATAFLSDRLDTLDAKAIEGLDDTSTLSLARDVRNARHTLDRFKELADQLAHASHDTSGGFLVGFADSMVKVMPKHLPANLDISGRVDLSLAGGEFESFQAAVVPFRGKVEDVAVRMSELTAPDGAKIASDRIDVDLQAYVKTEMRTEPTVDYMGWWPDPLIDTDETVDVDMGDLQSWWIRVRAPRDQSPGVYTGTLTVSAAGVEDLTFPVSVKVHEFNVPKHAPIPTAVTYVGRSLLKFPSITPESWEELKYAHTDMLNDYYMNMDSIYNRADPERFDAVDWDLVKYQKEKGTLVGFNITHFHGTKRELYDSIRPYYEKAKELGVLRHAYLYGYDETPPYTWEGIEESTKGLEEKFPELMTMVTSQDHSYGFNSPIKHLDAWCPILSRYNPTLAEKAREEGRHVWWYTCVWPPHPYPNVFVDYPSVDNRVLTGLFHMKYRPDGFLYYATTMWRGDEELNTYPYSNWNPNSFGTTNGDGSYFVLGEGGKLIPTIRVENYRDGFEDLAYYMILNHQVRLAEEGGPESSDSRWLARAKAALERVHDYVPSRERWTTAPADIRDYREELAGLIEASPVRDTNPWKGGMGIRGIDWNR